MTGMSTVDITHGLGGGACEHFWMGQARSKALTSIELRVTGEVILQGEIRSKIRSAADVLHITLMLLKVFFINKLLTSLDIATNFNFTRWEQLNCRFVAPCSAPSCYCTVCTLRTLGICYQIVVIYLNCFCINTGWVKRVPL